VSWIGGAWAQDAADGTRFWSFQPSLSVRQVVTDNHRLTPIGEGDAITELGGGLRLAMQGSNLQGALDYQVTGLMHAKHTDRNTARHQLAANAQVEAVQGQAYVNLRAGVSEQTLSAFGTLSTDGIRPSSNRDRVYSFAVAPYVVGRASNLFDYRVELVQQASRFRETPGFGFDRTSVSFNLLGDGNPFSWGADGEQQRTRYKGDDYRDESSLNGSLRYRLGQDFRVGASLGVESSDFGTERVSGRSTYGATAEWSPTGRTALLLSATKHYYGTTHGLDLSHRLERLVIAFSDRRDLSNGSVQGVPTSGALGALVARQFVGPGTPPAQSGFAVQDFLRANGIDPNAEVISGFAANSASVARTQSLSAVWRGIRTTMSLRLAQAWSRQLEGVSGPLTDFQFSRILRQRGILGDLSYNPSPISTIGLTGTWQRNSGDAPAPTTELKSLGLNWSTRPSTRSEWSLGLRHTVFNSPTDPYKESSGYLGYRLQF
jgi:uncharacterized protein (PEP-CTERM system associated)